MKNTEPRTASSGRAKRVLVVEDERDLNELISLNLLRNGYEVINAFNGNDALTKARAEKPDLVLLDLMLPGLNGSEVTRVLKSDPKTESLPIVMLTALSEETDVVVGLKLGADDYVTKPFSMKILLARVETLVRRFDQNPRAEPGATITFGPLEMDLGKHEARVEGQPVNLTLTEFKLLSALAAARGRVLSRDQLMDKAIGTGVVVTDRAIDVHVTSIRRKLGDAASLLHTVRGVGYRLRAESDSDQ